ncbi:MAG: biopolymer transporter ExbD [Pirellulales bacterium]|nr:biopolymer transporter ExbD [Pirellulales bacterium]
MRVTKGGGGASGVEMDMTPMIDMTFQLIAFFMVAINFSEADQNQRIKLPASELAKPADAPLASPITLQLTDGSTVIMGAEEVPVTEIKPLLLREKQLLEAQGTDFKQANIIVRADRDAKTGRVQALIRTAQELGFEKFVLRAMQQRE